MRRNDICSAFFVLNSNDKIYSMKAFFYFLIAFSILSFTAQAQTKIIQDSGFIPGNIWFSKEPETAGETVRIYTLVWNASADDVSGTVSFFDNDTIIGKQGFILAGEGSSKILSVPWVVGDGYHKIYAQITQSTGGPRGSKASDVSLEFARTSESEQFVSAQIEPSGVTSTATSFVEEKIGFVKDYAEVNLPRPVVENAKTAASSSENWRTSVEDWSKETIATLQKSIASSTAAERSDEGFNIKRPLQYVAIFALSVAAFIFSHPWLFYAIAVLVAFFVLRFIKRRFFF